MCFNTAAGKLDGQENGPRAPGNARAAAAFWGGEQTRELG